MKVIQQLAKWNTTTVLVIIRTFRYHREDGQVGTENVWLLLGFLLENRQYWKTFRKGINIETQRKRLSIVTVPCSEAFRNWWQCRKWRLQMMLRMMFNTHHHAPSGGIRQINSLQIPAGYVNNWTWLEQISEFSLQTFRFGNNIKDAL